MIPPLADYSDSRLPAWFVSLYSTPPNEIVGKEGIEK